MQEYRKVLHDKNFFLLWLGQGVSNLGTNISHIGLTWLVIEVTGKASSVSLLFILLTLPSVLFGPLSGVLVDKWNKKNIIVLSDVIRGLLSLGMFFYINNIVYIYILAFAHHFVSTFFRRQ